MAHLAFESTKEFANAMSIHPDDFVSDEYVKGDAPFVSYTDHVDAVEKDMEAFELSGQQNLSVDQIADKFDLVAIQDEEDGYEFFGAIQVPRLAGIANEYGVLQIGSTVIQYKGTKTFHAEFENVTDFADLSTALNVEITSGLGVVSEMKKPKKTERSCTGNYFTNGADHRIKVRWYSQEYKVGPKDQEVDFIDIWINVRHQKRAWWRGWVANEEDRMQTFGSVTHHIAGDDINNLDNSEADKVRDDVSSFDETIMMDQPRDYPLDTPDKWIVSPSNVTHRCREDGGQWRSCQIIE
jgi:hypothetical protein